MHVGSVFGGGGGAAFDGAAFGGAAFGGAPLDGLDCPDEMLEGGVGDGKARAESHMRRLPRAPREAGGEEDSSDEDPDATTYRPPPTRFAPHGHTYTGSATHTSTGTGPDEPLPLSAVRWSRPPELHEPRADRRAPWQQDEAEDEDEDVEHPPQRSAAQLLGFY